MADLCDVCGKALDVHAEPVPLGLGAGRERRTRSFHEIPCKVAPGKVVTVKVARACYQGWIARGGTAWASAEALALARGKAAKTG